MNSDEQAVCEGGLSETECFEVLKSMVADKSAGNDGLPSEFYKVFWNVADILINSFNYSYKIEKLSISQRRGIIHNLYQERMLTFIE